MADTLEDLPEVSVSNENKPLFTPELVLDSRLCIKDSLPFAVQKSASRHSCATAVDRNPCPTGPSATTETINEYIG